MAERAPDKPRGFADIRAWVFDVDNTLYPADCNLFSQIDSRMGAFISERLGLSPEAAHRLRKHYYYTYGTTLAGLMKLHDVKPDDFLDYVHDIDLSVIDPAPELARAIAALPGEKYVFTNGSKQHAERIIERLGLVDLFADMFDIRAADFVPKPNPETYEQFVQVYDLPAPAAAIFDDLPHNLKPAHALGMTTVLVTCGVTDHPEHEAIAGWSQLPSHIHYRTDALADFLSEIESEARSTAERLADEGIDDSLAAH